MYKSFNINNNKHKCTNRRLTDCLWQAKATLIHNTFIHKYVCMYSCIIINNIQMHTHIYFHKQLNAFNVKNLNGLQTRYYSFNKCLGLKNK